MIAIDLSPLVLDPRRGVSRALLHLLQGIRQVGHPGVRVEGFAPPAPPDDPRPGLPSLGLDALHTTGPAALRPRTWRRALAPALRACGAKVLLSPWAAFPRTPLPVVAWIHEVPFARHGALEGSLRTLRHRRALARAVERAAALVVPSDAVRSDLLALHPDAERRVHVVHHGFDPAPWASARALPGTKPYALLLGTGRGGAGARKKGVDLFVGAIAGGRLAGLGAIVVGTAPDLPPDIQVVPEPDDHTLAVLIAGARVVVVPSRSEGFGFPVLEAFAAGVPVVASAAGALPEVSGGAARLVPSGDADALAEAILLVATDEPLRVRLIAAGRGRAEEFPVAACARAWLRILTKAGGIPWHD